MVSEQAAQGFVVHRVGGVLEAIDLDRGLVHARLLLERLDGHLDLHGRAPDERREFTRAVGQHGDAVAAHEAGRGIDGVHDVVERLGQDVDVLAADGRDEGAVQALDGYINVISVSRRPPRAGNSQGINNYDIARRCPGAMLTSCFT